jgi:hypothetical protein
MNISRREFMKLFGISMASLLLVRCKPATLVPQTTSTLASCYMPTIILDTPTHLPAYMPRERLRLGWLRFSELAEKTKSGENREDETPFGDPLGQEMIADHRAALDELVAAGEIEAPVADLIQEAYAAAIYHIWRSNTNITCYRMSFTYAPTSAGTLVLQAETLEQVASQGDVDPNTLATVQSALEHDMAFYALTDEEISAMYEQLIRDSQEKGTPIPAFEELDLELTPESRAAAQFIIDLLTGK